jgi:hypothetical protein
MLIGTLDPISNRADWVVTGEVRDPDNGNALVDLSSATIVAFITRAETPHCALITFSTEDSTITITGTGLYTFTATATQLSCLCEGRYKFFVRATINDITDQLLSADLPIVEGGPSA